MKKKTKEFCKNKERGITLIALVITIIVLLILAGVTIATLTGDNGIITRTNQAKEETEKAGAKERVQVEALGSFDEYGKFDMDKLKENLKENLGIQESNIKDNGDGSITVTLDGYEVTVDSNGNVTIEGEATIAELTDIYPTLYTDGTLGFSNNTEKIEGKEIEKEYENIKGKEFLKNEDIPWYNERTKIKNVIFTNEIVPVSLRAWFIDCSKLSNLENLQNLNSTRVISMAGMFNNCTSLTNIDLSNFDTPNLEDISFLFSGCTELTNVILDGLNAENVKNMLNMFRDCSSLTNINLSNFHTPNLENMELMFYGCSQLTSIDLSSFNTSKVTNMNSIFAYCESLTSITFGSNFDTSKVQGMEGMFGNCKSLTELDLTTFDTSSTTTRNAMFMGCENMTKILVGDGWTEPSESDLLYMFRNCGVQNVTKVTNNNNQ